MKAHDILTLVLATIAVLSGGVGATVEAEFTLEHVFFHGFGNSSRAGDFHAISASDHRLLQVTADNKYEPPQPLAVHTKTLYLSRRTLHSHESLEKRTVGGVQQYLGSTEKDEWEDHPANVPDVSNKPTEINLAKMCSDTYAFAPSEPGWLNSSLGFNRSDSFGWVGDGLRGHVFSDKRNETVIVAFKGTTIDPRDKWRNNDRLNDNLLFSCCCASQRPDPFWYGPVCDCDSDTFQCNATCVTQELLQKDRYYPTAIAVMQNVTSWYPNASFWVIGHSLGGAVASLVGLTYNMPSITFEAPPQRLPAQRLGIAIPPHTADYHIGNTADPVFMGACNGYFSTCSIAGYAFESQCHTGKRCVYDTVSDKGWHMNINNHRLNVVIPDVLESYNSTPICESDDECVDCFNWNFNSSQTHRP
ncbi:hypothetical protein PV08_00805 [Exophiala spinifera]|uniref:Putative lipase ATG15 n=1 Tax=Exophiala spinifera TaxID=91928 RepID=A0A0D2BNX2_9EURO|nr:uncharacterized protein PV08_00805 [Exophiala spinifera]KIW20230.1 hypothetical protein PV08_00805 [Exophiala spinifera]